jgi:hypothetical protein
MSDMIKGDTSTEAWREYDFGGRTYRINLPAGVYYRVGGATHRVVTLEADGKEVTHCVPAPGVNGCVLRWQGHDGKHGITW